MMRKIKKLSIITLLMIFCVCSGAMAYEKAPVFSVMYHDICNEKKEETAFKITQGAFEEDIRYFAEHGYTFCFASEIDDFLKNSPNKPAVVITVDDGYVSGYTKMLPILEKYNAKATFFVIGNKIGKSNFMSEEVLQKMSQSPYVEIGNHSDTIHQKQVEDVWTLYKRDAMSAVKDFCENAVRIEKITGKKITSLSYPYGVYTEYLNAILNYNGYTTFSSDESGILEKGTPYPRYNRSAKTNIRALEYNAKFLNSSSQIELQQVKAYVNGAGYASSVYMKSNTAMLPVKFIAENLNAGVKNKQAFGTVTITKNDMEIVIENESDKLTINGEVIKMPEKAVIYKNEMYVPVRTLSEVLGAEVVWDGKYKTVLVY